MSDPPLPDLDDGVLDDAGLDALLTDLAALGEDLEVRCKGADVHSAPSTLAESAAALRAGSVRAMQVSYRYDGRRWVDTVMRAPEGWRVVRYNPQL